MAVVVLCCVMLYPTEVMAAVENTQRMDALRESQQQPDELASEEGGGSQESLPVSEQETEQMQSRWFRLILRSRRQVQICTTVSHL